MGIEDHYIFNNEPEISHISPSFNQEKINMGIKLTKFYYSPPKYFSIDFDVPGLGEVCIKQPVSKGLCEAIENECVFMLKQKMGVIENETETKTVS